MLLECIKRHFESYDRIAPKRKCSFTKTMQMCAGYELLPHSPYLPDLAPSDHFLFKKVKICLGEKTWLRRRNITETNPEKL